MLLKRSFFITIGLLIAMFIVACGSSTSTGGGAYGTGSSASAPTSSTNSSVMIKTTAATVKGKSETILTNADGKTLYYFTPDTATSAACASGCIGTWPPLLSSSSPASSSALSGTLSVQTDANGSQVEYNGHPLYFYAGDTAAGQMNGEGVGGKWFVATPDISVQSGGSSGGGYTKGY
jgi:predicted lipoprotein with Yx(FWY)xxD motif